MTSLLIPWCCLRQSLGLRVLRTRAWSAGRSQSSAQAAEGRERPGWPPSPWDGGSVLLWFGIFLGNYPVTGWSKGLGEE